ncbi:PAS domain-containing protein [Oricola sp.]|uniref:PAS domain-containing protein n=1 Tax=Oricola sp. TaxID=1979950 RepID=UPI003517119A
MQLSSLIGDYEICVSRLFAAIEAEDLAVIRELDIRMSWLRKAIRDFPAISEKNRRLQIEFFLDLLTVSIDQNGNVPPIADLRAIIDRNIKEFAGERTAPLRDHAESIASQLARKNLPDEYAVAAIEMSNVRISVIGRDLRYRYTSPANARFHGMAIEDIEGMHMRDLIGLERFEKRAKAYFERCFAGEELSYCYYLDTERHGCVLQECRMIPQYGPDCEPIGAIVMMREIKTDQIDPVMSAQENRV